MWRRLCSETTHNQLFIHYRTYLKTVTAYTNLIDDSQTLPNSNYIKSVYATVSEQLVFKQILMYKNTFFSLKLIYFIMIIYRVSLNSHYRLVVGTKVRFSILTHVWKCTVSLLQPKHPHITSWTLPLLLLTLRCFSSESTNKDTMWRPATSMHTRYLRTMSWYTRSSIPLRPTSFAVITRARIYM